MKLKKWIGIGLLVTMAVGLFGCGGQKEQQATTAESQQAPLKIGLLRIDDSLPFYVADKEGYFAASGVNVELVEFGSGRDQAMALAAGELDGMMTDAVVATLSRADGNEVQAVTMALGATPEEGRFLIVSAPNSGITTPEQLIGKKVAISNNTMMDYLVYRYEEILGLDATQIQTVNMPDLMLRTTTLLEGKDIDAAILPDPLAAFAVAQGANIVIDDTKLGQNVSQSIVVMTKKSIAERPQDIQSMLAGYNQAIATINDHPEDWKAFAMEHGKVPEAIAEGYKTPSFTADTLPTKEELQPVLDWMVMKGLASADYQYEDLINTSFIQ